MSSASTNPKSNVVNVFKISLRFKASILKWKKRHGGEEEEKKDPLPIVRKVSYGLSFILL